MKLPDAVLDTRDRYVEAFPLWVMPVVTEEEKVAAEARARSWTAGLQAQVAFEHPNNGYGSKRSSETNPVTKDALAQQTGSTILCWDMLGAAGSGAPEVVENPESKDVSDQVFVYIAPRNVIAGEGEIAGPPASAQIPYDEQKSIEFGTACNDTYAESGAAFDPGMISVHSQRCAWDYYVAGMDWDECKDKHVNEFRAVYGLPPV